MRVLLLAAMVSTFLFAAAPVEASEEPTTGTTTDAPTASSTEPTTPWEPGPGNPCRPSCA